MHPSKIPLTLSADVLRLPYTPAIRLVLAEIVSLYTANHCCDATDPHFAARLSINKDTASEAVKKLVADGLLMRVTTPTASGSYRTLTPNPAAIAAKAATNPYPETTQTPRRNFRLGTESRAGNSGDAAPEIPAGRTGNSGDATPEFPAGRTGNSGANSTYNNTGNNTILNNDAAGAAALVSEKKIEAVEVLSPELTAAVVVSAPRCAAPPSKKPVLMRDSPLATFPAFEEAWKAATEANAETHTDYANADLLHYHQALLDWSDAKGEKRLDWLATIRSSMRSDVTKRKLRVAGADSPVLKRVATAEAAFALNEYDEAGNRLN